MKHFSFLHGNLTVVTRKLFIVTFTHMLPVVLHARRETSEIVGLNDLHFSVPNILSADT